MPLWLKTTIKLNMFKFISTLIFFSVSLPSVAASFDCELARTEVENMVCNNSEILQLDSILNESYINARKETVSTENQSLVLEQKRWIKNRIIQNVRQSIQHRRFTDHTVRSNYQI